MTGLIHFADTPMGKAHVREARIGGSGPPQIGRLCQSTKSDSIAKADMIAPDRRRFMLELRPSCECCDKDLPPTATDAMICTFECTFCCDCVENKLKGVCPNCGGNFAPRPIRPASKLFKNPPSTRRVFNPAGCGR
jgi:uncharacterized protein